MKKLMVLISIIGIYGEMLPLVQVHAFDWRGSVLLSSQYFEQLSEQFAYTQQVNLIGQHGFGRGETTHGYLALRGVRDVIDSHELRSRLLVREAYFTFSALANWEFTLGRKIVMWGKADEINPVDFVSSEDLSNFIFFSKGERLLANDLVEVKYFIGDYTVAVLVIPTFTPNLLPESDSLWSSAYYTAVEATSGLTVHNPRQPDNQWQTGIRFSATTNELDYDLLFYHGFQKNPVYEFSASGSTVTPFYGEYNGFGIAGAMALGPFTWRSEIGYRDKSYEASRNGYAISPLLEVSIGCDWQYAKTYLNFQYVRSEVLQHQPDIYRAEVTDMILGKFNQEILDTNFSFALQGGGVVGRLYSMYFNPSFSYNWRQLITTSIGGFAFIGSDNSIWAKYLAQDFYYIKLLWSF